MRPPPEPTSPTSGHDNSPTGTAGIEAAARYGVSSMSAPLRRVAMRAPGALLTADHERWHYLTPVDAAHVRDEYDAFAALIGAHAEILWLDGSADDGLADSVFTYDPSFVIPQGAIVLRSGKELRRGEHQLHRRLYEREAIPVVGEIDVPGAVDGGDLCWLTDSLLAVGRSWRTNQSGIDQLRGILDPHGVEIVPFDLPHHRGPDACLHLLSLVNPVDADLALVHAPLVPVALHQLMHDLGYTLLVVPDDEFDASYGLALNVLALAPRECVAIDGWPATHSLLRDAGCEVHVVAGHALCVNCEGGPTCLTRPILRR